MCYFYYRTALNAGRCSYEKDVCPSVCQNRTQRTASSLRKNYFAALINFIHVIPTRGGLKPNEILILNNAIH